MDLKRIANNIDPVINKLPGYAVEILDAKHKKEVIEIQQSQLLEGIRGDGKRTQTYRSETYVRKTNKQNAASYPNRNYYNKGDYFDGMDTGVQNDSLLMFSLDSKASILEKEEDNELLGIAPKNVGEIASIKGFAKELITKTGYELSR